MSNYSASLFNSIYSPFTKYLYYEPGTELVTELRQ